MNLPIDSRRTMFTLAALLGCTTFGACTPVPATLVTTGDSHTCALFDGGSVRCWGNGSTGALGYGNTNDIGDNEIAESGGDVPLGGNAITVSAGNAHTCAVMSGGDVRCWGWGSFGRLGYNGTNNIGDNETPAGHTVNLGGTAVAVAAGGLHTCALLTGGRVRCWGHGGDGALGYGNIHDIGDNENPSSAGDVAVGGTVSQVVAGAFHTCAMTNSGSVICWGANDSGQLGYQGVNYIGDNELPNSAGAVLLGYAYSPFYIPGPDGKAAQITAGYAHTCAVTQAGGVRCWGWGAYGQLGYGNTHDVGRNQYPAAAGDVTLSGQATQVSAGTMHTCALLVGGAVQCWGLGSSGQLGYGNTNSIGDNETPASAGTVSLGEPAIKIAAGGAHTCAVLQSGNIRCWGSGADGRLGYGNTNNIGDNELPTAVDTVPVNPVQ
jgi:alpha-tubulin suppressor-like RCC1 family protein